LAGDYQLWVEHSGGAVGANDFYVIYLYRRSDNDRETEAENNTLETAQAITLEPSGSLNSSFILARLPDDDIDYFSFAVAANQRVSVVCRSRGSGSGLADLQVAIHDAADEVLASVTEDQDRAYIRDANPNNTAAGTFYLRLSKTGQDDDVTGNWVRCGVHSRDR
jgi:hypothetical protein